MGDISTRKRSMKRITHRKHKNMGIEQQESDFSFKGEKKTVTPLRLRIALKELVGASVKKTNLLGKEHLSEIPADKKVIIATTHITDIDVPVVASELANEFDLALAHKSTQRSFMADPMTYVGINLAGKNNFLPLDFKKGGKIGEFNPENFVPMEEALEKGKTVVISAHNPTYDGNFPEKGGFGVAYLASLEDNTIILPVAVRLESEETLGMAANPLKTLLKRPEATVMIGKPFELEKIGNIENLKKISEKRKARKEKLTKEDLLMFHEISMQLREQSSLIMDKLAEMLGTEEKEDMQKESPMPINNS